MYNFINLEVTSGGIQQWNKLQQSNHDTFEDIQQWINGSLIMLLLKKSNNGLLTAIESGNQQLIDYVMNCLSRD